MNLDLTIDGVKVPRRRTQQMLRELELEERLAELAASEARVSGSRVKVKIGSSSRIKASATTK